MWDWSGQKLAQPLLNTQARPRTLLCSYCVYYGLSQISRLSLKVLPKWRSCSYFGGYALSGAYVLDFRCLGVEPKSSSSSEYEIIEAHHPAMSVDPGWHVAIRGFNLNDYSYVEAVDQIADPSHVSRDVYAGHFSMPLKGIPTHQFSYTHGMVTVTFSSVVNLTDRHWVGCLKIWWAPSP